MSSDSVFEKTGPASLIAMFEAEAEGLRELGAAGAIRVPEVFDVGIRDDEAFIAMERLELGRASGAEEARFGEQLAALHAHTEARFGWQRDNTIGMTPQENTWSADWIEFFRSRRLRFQLDLAAEKGYGDELMALGETLEDGLASLFVGHTPDASLLHGDLWGGNWGVVAGEPVIFDPAVYYGDSETDIAMTGLFGGFGKQFYEAYFANRPLADGGEARLELYRLYHVLNHLNLFGTGYLGQAVSIMRALCRVL